MPASPPFHPHTLTLFFELSNFTGKQIKIMDRRFEFQKPQRENLMTDAVIIVDKKTGVNYLFVRSGYGAGLTPLLDPDGKPIITK